MFLITAFILGILVSINPCQIAISLSAITFIKKQVNKNNRKNIDNQQNPNAKIIFSIWMYVIGKALTYTLLGWAICLVVGNGHKLIEDLYINEIGEWIERVIPYILLIIGVYMFYRAFHRHEHHGDSCHNSGKIIHNRHKFPPMVLGMLLALAFCPESAIMYFSLFTIETSMLSPILFSIGAAIPIIMIGYAIDKSSKRFTHFQDRLKNFQRWLNIILGCLFILFAIYLFVND